MPVLERVAPDEALLRIRNALGDKADRIETRFDQVGVWCRPENLVAVVTTLKETDGIDCRFFTFLSAVDLSEFPLEEGDEQPGLEVLVHLYSPRRTIHVTVHVPLPADRPTCPTLTGVYLGAIWHEREAAEMFGIDFEGHPRLVGLYLTEDFEGHPLLKSFKLPSRALVKEWPGAKDPDEAAAGGR